MLPLLVVGVVIGNYWCCDFWCCDCVTIGETNNCFHVDSFVLPPSSFLCQRFGREYVRSDGAGIHDRRWGGQVGKKVREQWVVQFGEQWQVPNGVDGKWASGIAFEKFVGEKRNVW